MTDVLLDTMARRATDTTPRRAALRLLALAAGSGAAALTQAREKNIPHTSRIDRGDGDFTRGKIDSARERFGSRWQLYDDMTNVTGRDQEE